MLSSESACSIAQEAPLFKLKAENGFVFHIFHLLPPPEEICALWTIQTRFFCSGSSEKTRRVNESEGLLFLHKQHAVNREPEPCESLESLWAFFLSGLSPL